MRVFPTVPTKCEKLRFWMIRALFYGLKIIGLAPLSIDIETRAGNSGNTSVEVFLFSKIGLLYNLVLGVLLQITGVYKFPALMSVKYPNKSVVTQVMDEYWYILTVLAGSFIVVYLALRQKKSVIIMNVLTDVHFLLSGAREQSSNKRTYILPAVQMAFHVLLWATSVSVSDYIYDSYWSMVIINWMQLIIYCFFMEYSLILRGVARKLEILHQHLSDLNDFPSYLFRTSLPNEHLAILGLTAHSQLATLKLVRSVRTTISEVSQDIADFFSLPMILSIAYVFITLIYAVYFINLTLFVSTHDASSMSATIQIVLWLLRAVFPLIFLSFNVTEIAKKAKLTGIIVHKSLATARKPEIIAELKQFSLQLLQDDVIFMAYGFFNLDFTLLHSICGATATYVLIIIQFVQRPDDHKN